MAASWHNDVEGAGSVGDRTCWQDLLETTATEPSLSVLELRSWLSCGWTLFS